MQSNTKQLSIGVALAVLLLGGGTYYASRDLGFNPFTAQNSEPTTTPAYTLDELIEQGKVEVITEEGEAPPLPNLDRPVTFPADFPEEAKPIAREKIATLTAKVKTDPLSYTSWIDLGSYRKIIGDYVGAKEAWEYAATIGPGAALAFHNLGVLSFEYLNDLGKAESYLKQGLKNDPSSLNTYAELHRFYRYWYKTDTTLAADTLKDAIAKYPDALDLIMLLASYYKEMGNKAEAKRYFEQALGIAEAKGNTDLVARIEGELDSLN